MTIEEAEQKALEWKATHEDANAEEECECYGAAERLRNEARAIEKAIEAAGYNACDLIRTIERRRRAL